MQGRIKRIFVTPECLVLSRPGAVRVVENDVPEGARVVGVGYDSKRSAFEVFIEHSSFPETFEGWALETMRGPVFAMGNVPRGWTADNKTPIPEGTPVVANEDGRPLFVISGVAMPVSDCKIVPIAAPSKPTPPSIEIIRGDQTRVRKPEPPPNRDVRGGDPLPGKRSTWWSLLRRTRTAQSVAR